MRTVILNLADDNCDAGVVRRIASRLQCWRRWKSRRVGSNRSPNWCLQTVPTYRVDHAFCSKCTDSSAETWRRSVGQIGLYDKSSPPVNARRSSPTAASSRLNGLVDKILAQRMHAELLCRRLPNKRTRQSIRRDDVMSITLTAACGQNAVGCYAPMHDGLARTALRRPREDLTLASPTLVVSLHDAAVRHSVTLRYRWLPAGLNRSSLFWSRTLYCRVG